MRVVANGCDLDVSVRGEGSPTLVFLHYFAGSSRAWTAVVAQLESAYRCVMPDLRGFGNSEALSEGYSVTNGANDVARVIEQIVTGPYVLIGHSMGGKLALALAAQRPAGLQALVLVAPSPPTPEPTSPRQRGRTLAAYGSRHAAVETAQRLVVQPLAAPDSALVIADSMRTSRAAWYAWIAHGSQEDWSGSVDTIDVPTLVVAGEQDPVFSAALLQREVAARILGARLVVVPDVGHLIPLEAPLVLAAHIRNAVQADWPAISLPAVDSGPSAKRASW